MQPLRRLRARDPNLVALRRAARAALVMPAMFALGEKVIGNPAVATFAAFGSFAMLLLVDFAGPVRERLQAQAALAVAGGVLVCVATLASRSAWIGAVAMALVGFGVLFAGVVSSVLAGATVSLLLAFILPVSLPGPSSSIPDRLAGWGMASAAALIAVACLWPAPVRDPLRAAAIATCRALAARLRSDTTYLLSGGSTPSEHEAAIEQAGTAVAGLQHLFFKTPYRPTGLTTAARTVIRLVDELNWLSGIVVLPVSPPPAGVPVNRASCAVRERAASVLEHSADLLEDPAALPDALTDALTSLRQALSDMERSTTLELPPRPAQGAVGATSNGWDAMLISSLDPSFRAQELSFAVAQIARNVELTAAAERRSWLDRLLGRQQPGLAGALSAARERAAAHVQRNSVWLHNSLRGGVGLGVAVLVARLFGVQHAFWVVLGTLSVLRSNALSTGQNAVRGLIGTVAGFVIGAALLLLIGTSATVLWVLLPAAILFAGVTPAALSFAAGQAAFTVVLVILFNILQPAGWQVGLLRVEDVALGCAVSLAVGLLFWPRGAAAALGRALADAYADSARYLADTVSFAVARCDSSVPPRPAPTETATRAAAASRRVDDAFRGYLAERGTKRLPLADVTGLVNGAAALRLAGDAVLDLWQRDGGRTAGDRAAARRELVASAETILAWYEGFADSLVARGDIPDPLPRDELANGRLIAAVRHNLYGEAGRSGAVAVRVIWTGDHLDAARRLQPALVRPARAAVERLSVAQMIWARSPSTT